MGITTDDLLALACASVLTVTVVAMHYEALRLLSGMNPRRWTGRVNVGVLIVCIIVAHILEALVFAVGYWLSGSALGLGGLSGPGPIAPIVYFYFSLETFTTQSLGDISPVGATRLIASIEPLVGLILIGWSTSFTYIIMRRDWQTGTSKQAAQAEV
ncbi:ion channel [Cupriavidus basilensis]|uniref:ion channel n=1 Tax=Cupriavidus TaxID=106589 RepID=UPI000446BB96|nr:ion channel [Cupriavidus basilensis]KJK23011.1 potassium transporter Kef [Burkholderiaceae bacterium 16]MDF3880920.1 ion channel [Cupriavidus basilensis]